MKIPWEEIRVEDAREAGVQILGVPFDGGASAGRGACEGPDRLRELSYVMGDVTETGIILRNLGLKDAGDVPPDLDWDRYFSEVEERAFPLLQSEKFEIFLGGDHSVSIPLKRAFCRFFEGEKLGVIHFDAHPDTLDKYNGHSWSHACTLRRALELPGIFPKDVALLGVRTYMEEELFFLQENEDILTWEAREIHRRGMEAVLESLHERFRDHHRLYLSIDIDVLDPAFAPGVGSPESGGLSSRELLDIVRQLVLELPVEAMDLVEYSPPLDCSNITGFAALKILYECLGSVCRRQGLG